MYALSCDLLMVLLPTLRSFEYISGKATISWSTPILKTLFEKIDLTHLDLLLHFERLIWSFPPFGSICSTLKDDTYMESSSILIYLFLMKRMLFLEFSSKFS